MQADNGLYKTMMACWPGFVWVFGEYWAGPSPLCKQRDRAFDRALRVWPNGTWHDLRADKRGDDVIGLVQHILRTLSRAEAQRFVKAVMGRLPGNGGAVPGNTGGASSTIAGDVMRKAMDLGSTPRERADVLLHPAEASAPKHRALVPAPRDFVPVQTR